MDRRQKKVLHKKKCLWYFVSVGDYINLLKDFSIANLLLENSWHHVLKWNIYIHCNLVPLISIYHRENPTLYKKQIIAEL